jgi:hypothetical protein
MDWEEDPRPEDPLSSTNEDPSADEDHSAL